MESIYSLKPLLAVLTSILVIPILVSCRNSNIREVWTFIAAFIKLSIIVSMLPAVLAGKQPSVTIYEVLPGIALRFQVDAFGLLFAIVASFLWIITSAYSIGYMRGLKEHSQTRYFCFFALSLSATIGVAFSGNLLTMYLFYEMLSFSTYPLVTHHQDREARTSGRKYLVYILGPSIGFVLPAMLISYHMSGTLEFAGQGFLADQGTYTRLLVLLLLFIFGFAKAGIMPFHSWLPAAMVAPTPVSALLHAVAVVKVGVFCVARVMTGVFGTKLLFTLQLNTVICWIASITVITSSLIALSQDGLKRRLAFSTIGQLSYIVLGFALLSRSGMEGGMLHIAMHAFGKITLFFCAGAIFVATGVKNISEMQGIGKRMPITMAAFFIGSLSVIGLPPCGGFISKWLLLTGTVQAGHYVMLAVLLTSSLLNAAYFLPIVYNAFFCRPGNTAFQNGIQEAPAWCVVPLSVTAIFSIVLFFYPQPFLQLSRLAVGGFLGEP
jgi:multicomponent Na+:H+ antiporter subunit D